MRVFSEGEWATVQWVAEGLEWGGGWEARAAQRLRFVLDFAYATGLRVSELVGATLAQIEVDGDNDQWLHLVGKGGKGAEVALPPWREQHWIATSCSGSCRSRLRAGSPARS